MQMCLGHWRMGPYRPHDVVVSELGGKMLTAALWAGRRGAAPMLASR